MLAKLHIHSTTYIKAGQDDRKAVTAFVHELGQVEGRYRLRAQTALRATFELYNGPPVVWLAIEHLEVERLQENLLGLGVDVVDLKLTDDVFTVE
jgi:hypothetical protein